ncbi:MAG: hypothetical protein CML68_06455 [Rhodobacteraceae bacterium]|nr:hypothetical protein [Paracoccaceae bacterium]
MLGGFFGLELPDPDRTGDAGGLWRHWRADEGRAFANASSALAALITHLQPGAVWFPAFLCAEFAGAAAPGLRRFFALDDDLAPDPATLSPAPGDLVVAVDYFGRAPGECTGEGSGEASGGCSGTTWRDFVAAHPQVTFVEDCAQAIDTGQPPWGDWRLYSPRKIAGIPDGGILVPMRGQALPPAPVPPAFAQVQAALAPKLARLEAPAQNALWHPLNQAHEAAHAVTDLGMSTFSRRLAGLIDVQAISARRHANFRALAGPLADWAVIADPDPGFVPFGFPVRLAPGQRDAVAGALYARGIFPAVHWRDLPVPRDPGGPAGRTADWTADWMADWTADWTRADTFLTLPCDQRWSVSDMGRMVDAFTAALDTRLG